MQLKSTFRFLGPCFLSGWLLHLAGRSERKLVRVAVLLAACSRQRWTGRASEGVEELSPRSSLTRRRRDCLCWCLSWGRRRPCSCGLQQTCEGELLQRGGGKTAQEAEETATEEVNKKLRQTSHFGKRRFGLPVKLHSSSSQPSIYKVCPGPKRWPPF